MAHIPIFWHKPCAAEQRGGGDHCSAAGAASGGVGHWACRSVGRRVPCHVPHYQHRWECSV